MDGLLLMNILNNNELPGTCLDKANRWFPSSPIIQTAITWSVVHRCNLYLP
jgi:hypothetical protein